MLTSIAANHAKGKSAEDTIFAANAACVAAAKKIGAENVTNATIGAILDEDEKLVCLPTVDKVFRSLSTDELIAYAPISGLPDYLEEVLNAAFGDSRPEGYMAAVATSGGTGVIHHAIWNYMDEAKPPLPATGTGTRAACSATIWAASSTPIPCWTKTTNITCLP